MAAAYLALNSDNGLAIEQGADYGPILFRFREQTWDEYTATIVDPGSAGETFTVKVFQSASDSPELAAQVVYTVQAGDSADDVSLGLQALLGALTVYVENATTGEMVATSITDLIRVTDTPGNGAFNIKAITKALFLDVQVDADVPANISLSHDTDVQLDLTGASAKAEIRAYASSGDVLVTWTTVSSPPDPDTDYLTVQTPATRGLMTLEKIPASATEGYTFESGWWQMELTRTLPESRTDRWFEGPVENKVSLFLQ